MQHWICRTQIIADHPPKQVVIMCKYFVSLKFLILPTSRIFNTEDQFIVNGTRRTLYWHFVKHNN